MRGLAKMKSTHPLKNFTRPFINPLNKIDFLRGLSPNASILDVGCGNNSPFFVKKILPKCAYTGIDVGDYNQTKPILADNYLITSSESFADEIRKFANSFDAVISTHNLEHCDEREKTLEAMLKALKVGGRIFLSFPCEQSVSFPKRGGTLNYYDDQTHKFSPPSFKKVLGTFEELGFQLNHAAKNYSPKIYWIVGFIQEPISKFRNKVMRGTWSYYGFESIIIATKTKPTQSPS